MTGNITIGDIVTAALVKGGVIAGGGIATDDQMSDGIRDVNSMLSEWSASGLVSPETVREAFPLVVGKAQYTVGNNGDFDTARPVFISDAFITQTDGITDVGVDLSSIIETYNSITDKTSQGIPAEVYYRIQSPFTLLFLYPTPDDVYSLTIESRKEFPTFYSDNDAAAFQPAVQSAIIYNLALRMTEEYGLPLRAITASIASGALNALSVVNKKEVEASDFGIDVLSLTRSRGRRYGLGGIVR